MQIRPRPRFFHRAGALALCAAIAASPCLARAQSAPAPTATPTAITTTNPDPSNATLYPTPNGISAPGRDTFTPTPNLPIDAEIDYPFSTCTVTNLPTPNLTEPVSTVQAAADAATEAVPELPSAATQVGIHSISDVSSQIAEAIRTSLESPALQTAALSSSGASSSKTQTAAAKSAAAAVRAKLTPAGYTTKQLDDITNAVQTYLANPALASQPGAFGSAASPIAQTASTRLNYNGVQTYLLRLRACELAIDRRYTDVYTSRQRRANQVDYDIQAAHFYCRLPSMTAQGDLVFNADPVTDTPTNSYVTLATVKRNGQWNAYRLAVIDDYTQLYELLTFCQTVATQPFPTNNKRFLCVFSGPSATLTTLGVAVVATGGLSATLKAVAVALAGIAGGCGGGGGSGAGNAAGATTSTTSTTPTVGQGSGPPH